MPLRALLDTLLYWCALPLARLVALLPWRWAVAAGAVAGRLAFWLDRRHRLIAVRNLEIAFPEATADWRRQTARQCFENFGKTILELPGLRYKPARRILERVTFEGWEHYEEARRSGKGLLLLTGHIGNWELMALAHGLRGHRLRFVARPLDNRFADRWLSELRARGGNRVIPKRGASRGVYAALKRGEVVGLLMDQAVTGSDGVFVDFFGTPAGTSKGMAVLACRLDVPVLPVYIIRGEDEVSHRVVIEPQVPVTVTGDVEKDIRENTERFQKVLEAAIRRTPSQWFWMHRRWKDSPALGSGREGYPPK